MNKKQGITITWLGHACFKLESGGYAVVLDPYEDGYVPGLAPLRTEADQVVCSHGHGDHNAVNVVTLTGKGESPFQITVINTYHDDRQGALRGENKIHVFDNGSLRVAHLGDLGCEPTEEQKKQLTGLDAVMVPIGGHYTIDAVQARKLMDEIQPKVIIPMHYRSSRFGFDVLGTLEQFTDLCEVVVEYPGSVLEVTEDTRPHVAVLQYGC